MTTPEQIQKALSGLEVGNDNHWTQDGLPRLETIKLLAGDQSITREAVTAAAPGFSRANAIQAAAPVPAAPVVPAPPAAETPAAPAAAPAPAAAAPVATLAGLPSGLPQEQAASNPNPLANRPAVDNTATVVQLSEELMGIEKELAELDKVRAEMDKHYKMRQSRADDLRVRIDKLEPRSGNQEVICDYLKSRQVAAQQRADQLGQARNLEKQLGVKLADLIPKPAPIDVAMTRKTGFGGKRPG
jgi:hypothetical protein